MNVLKLFMLSFKTTRIGKVNRDQNMKRKETEKKKKLLTLENKYTFRRLLQALHS